jgi:hypothetical protein
VNNEVGAKTPLAQLVCGLLVMFVLLFLTLVFKFMPYNCLAAVIIIGVSSLVDLDTPIHFFKVSAPRPSSDQLGALWHRAWAAPPHAQQAMYISTSGCWHRSTADRVHCRCALLRSAQQPATMVSTALGTTALVMVALGSMHSPRLRRHANLQPDSVNVLVWWKGCGGTVAPTASPARTHT